MKHSIKQMLLLAACIASFNGVAHAETGTADSANSTVDTRDAEIAVESPTTMPISDGGTRSYGDVAVNGSNVTFPFVIRNVGGQPLTGISLGITGTDAGQFTITTNAAATVAPGNSTTAEVRFLPTSVGAKSVLLRITSNDANRNPYDITLTGTGLQTAVIPVSVAPGTKLAPTGAALVTLTPTFTWKAAANAAGYVLAITRSADDEVVYDNITLGQVTSFVLPESYLQGGMVYRWTLRSKTAAGLLSAESVPLHFTVAEAPPVPGAPKPTTPGTAALPGKLVSSLPPTFSWTAPLGALGHEIEIVNQSSNVPFRASDLTAVATYTPPGGTLAAGQIYWWRVRARNAAGWGLWSVVWYFETPATVVLPTAPTLLSPGSTTAPGAVLPALTPTLTWTAVPGATGYDLYIRKAATLTRALVREGLPPGSTSLEVPAGTLVAGTDYWWNVRVTTAAGTSNFAPRYFFKTAVAVPAPVITVVEPTSLVGSDVAQLVRFTGTGFSTGAKVWTASSPTLKAVTTSVVSDTLVVARLVVSKTAATWSAQVRNADGQLSNTVTFDVLAPAPALESPVFYLAGSASPSVETSVTYTQPVSVRITDNNSGPHHIRYTLDGSVPNEDSPTLNPFLANTPLLLGAQGKYVLTAVAVNGTNAVSAPKKLTLTFNLPTITVPASGAASGPSMTVATGASYYLKLVLPAGVANYNLSSDGTSPSPFFLAKGYLPLETDYYRASVPFGSPLKDQLNNLLGDAGTYFILVKPDAGDANRGKLTATAAKQITKLGPPIIHPKSGNQDGPLQVTMEYAWSSADAQIYYTLDGTYPQPSQPAGGSTRIYNGPFSVLGTTRVRAVVASALGTSLEASASFNVTSSDRLEPLPLVDEAVVRPDGEDSSHYPHVRTATLAVPITWAAAKGTPNIETYQFYFDVPADQNLGSKIEYPVGITVERELTHGGTFEMYIAEGQAATKTSTKLSALPPIDDGYAWVMGTPDKFLLGSRVGKGFNLIPGTRYYVLLEVGGNLKPNETSFEQLKFTLHSATLSSATNQPIQRLDNTWIVAHGRTNTGETPRIVEQADTLVAAAAPGRIGQVLRLNWGSMADTGLTVAYGDSIFTKPVGQRTGAVLRMLGLRTNQLSISGHSWGSHVAYWLGQDSNAKKLGVVQRLVACDPAGYYVHAAPNFASVATRSWSFVHDPTYFGSQALAGTAKEAFLLTTGGFTLDPDDTGPNDISQVDAHAAPFDLFTQLLSRRYGLPTTSTIPAIIADKFGIEQLDAQPGTWYLANQWPEWSVATPFEAQITGVLSGTGLDPAGPFVMDYTTPAPNKQDVQVP